MSPAQASIGIKAALSTSKALLDDALLLFKHQRYARATALAIIAIEEHGKVDIIKRLLLSEEGKPLEKVWQEYRHHHAKNILWLKPFLEKEGFPLSEQLNIVHQEGFQHNILAEDIKQAGFYSDISPEGFWFMPEEMVKEKTAKHFIGTAQDIIPKEAALTSPEALELMVKHVKLVCNTGDDALRKQAWLAFHQEAEAKGYIESGGAEKMREPFDTW